MTESNFAPAVISALSTRRKDKLYAAVVDENGDRRSVLWRFWTHGADFYGGGMAAGSTKMSLHASGRCRWAHVEPGYMGDPAADRAFIKWERPPPSTEPRLVARIVFPADHLAPPKPLEAVKGLLLKLPMPPPGKAAFLGVYSTSLDPRTLPLPTVPARELLAARTSSGETFLLATEVGDMPALPQGMTLNYSSRDATVAPSSIEGDGVVMNIWADPGDDGVASCIEISGHVRTGAIEGAGLRFSLRDVHSKDESLMEGDAAIPRNSPEPAS